MSGTVIGGGVFVSSEDAPPPSPPTSSTVTNLSDVPGATVTDALNFLYRLQYTAVQNSNRTAAIADRQHIIPSTAGLTVNIELPPVSSIPWQVGDWIGIEQRGAGQVWFTAGMGVTVQAGPSFYPRTLELGALVLARYVGSDLWLVSGDREPI